VFVILVMFSIVAVEFVTPVDIAFDDEYCDHAFSSVFECVIFFFKAVVIGDNWGDCIIPLMWHNWMWTFFFIGASMLIQIGVLNLVLAVIVDEANKATERDKCRNAAAVIEGKKRAAGRLQGIFRRMDTSAD